MSELLLCHIPAQQPPAYLARLPDAQATQPTSLIRHRRRRAIGALPQAHAAAAAARFLHSSVGRPTKLSQTQRPLLSPRNKANLSPLAARREAGDAIFPTKAGKVAGRRQSDGQARQTPSIRAIGKAAIGPSFAEIAKDLPKNEPKPAMQAGPY